MKKNRLNWLLALVLTLPLIVFFVSYWFNHSSNLIPTGFIQYDNVGYIAYGKQYPDTDTFHLLYSNPFNESGNYHNIYFQPQTLLFAFLLKTGIPAGFILIPFTIICSFFCFLVIIRIYDFLFPQSRHRLLSILFFAWGGGVLFLADIPAQLIYPSLKHFFSGQPLVLDPGGGWWGLSFGRSLFFSCEAYYHLIFMSIILSVLKKKWNPALLLLFVLSSSHPFTGIEILCILIAWSFIEKIVFKNLNIPVYFIAGVLLLFILHVFYYLYFLNKFPDHHSVSQQYALNWRLRFFNMIPAYFIVGVLSIITIRYLKWKNVFSNINYRLFASWFIVAFTLANHEVFIKPMQPIHFSRGYIWTSLFLFGLPGLHYFLNFIRAKKWSSIALLLFCIIFLLDNSAWIMNNVLSRAGTKSISYISGEEKNVLDLLSSKTNNTSLIIGYSDEGEAMIPYLATVYTKAWSWTSHPFTTPFIAKKKKAYDQFILNGTIDSSWIKRPCIFIFRKTDTLEMKRSAELNFPSTILADTKSYKIIAAEISAP